MAFNPTPEQQSAINERGNILVSAAAGSGKTAVLVERVVDRLTDKVNPINADRLLIVTFTNAAAAEMRTRIEKRLDAECRANPDDIGLLRQRQLLGSAKICTIDSFCIDLVRENFDKAGVSPDFKMSDGYSLTPVDEAVLSELLNRRYEDNDPVFFELLDIVGAEYDDGNLSDFILKIYDYSRQLPFPEKWFRELPEMYNGGLFSPENKWYKYAVNTAVSTAEKMRGLISNTVDIITGDEKTAQKYLPDFMLAAEMTDELYEKTLTRDWDTVYSAVNAFNLPPLTRGNGLTGIPQAAAGKLAWDYLGKDIEHLKRLFYGDIKLINSQFKKLYEPVKLLSELLCEFQNNLFEEYLRRGTFTFHNTEHLALKLLIEGGEEFCDRYDEVMVDEYQDTNDLQDMLFNVLSDGGKKLFAVGDVKQSIYGFRGANPENFMRKKNAAVSVEKAKDGEPKKIILGCNFRCRAEVCEYINYFFHCLMTENTGSIVYNDEEKLIPAAEYPAISEIPVSLDIISFKGSAEERLKAEAVHIAEFINKTVNSKECIRVDKDTLRKASYGDFTILLRSPKAKAPVIAEVLKDNGIPVNFTLDGFAETNEISVFLSLLKVIDNPESDIELLTVMMSPIFGFTAEETAQIRINRREGSLYSAVVFSSENGNAHCKEMLDTLQKYRIIGVVTPLDRLISRLLSETDYLNTVSASDGGERRRNNLLLLYDYAKQYAADSVGSIGGFVKYILKQSENGMKSAAVSAGGDTVKIMSIHASKGLQFPVCIVADTATEFNDSDARSNTLYSSKSGIGFKYFDEATAQKLSTVGKEVITDEIRKQASEEELRLLYVAMTRTQDRLMFTASFNDADKTVADIRFAALLSAGKTDALLSRAKSYAKWLLLTSVFHPDGKELRLSGTNIIPADTESRISINIFYPEIGESISREITGGEYIPDEALTQKIQESIDYNYPYSPLLSIEAKSSVSVLANKAESEKYAFSARPSFMSDGGITAAERGTAMHKVIEFIDFEKTDDLETEIERLYEWQFISEREMKAVSREKLKAFFESDLFARIKQSPLVKREMRFLTELEAKKIDPSLDSLFEGEMIVVQGAVDLCFEENGGITVLDFKTDRVVDIKRLAETYGEQLSIYAAACEKIFKKPVLKKIIYSFALSDYIEVY